MGPRAGLVKQSHNPPVEAQGKRRYRSYLFTTSALDGVNGQSHAPAALYPREGTPDTHCTGVWVCPEIRSGHRG
jgi:hypothetical protein